jgi:hypothetical protein
MNGEQVRILNNPITDFGGTLTIEIFSITPSLKLYTKQFLINIRQ